MNKFLFRSFSCAILLFYLSAPFVHATATEVSLSTFTGDFSEGGDPETDHRLLGNTSFHALGFLQDNRVRVVISSGHFWNTSSTPATAGYVGIATDWNLDIDAPQQMLDVRGFIRSTSGFIFADGSQQVTAGVSAISGAGKTPYTLIVGSQGATNVDVFVTNAVNFRHAQSSVGVNGLNYSSTATATMFFKNGTYPIGGSTIPAGLTIICSDSVTFVASDVTGQQQMINNYGKILGPCGFSGGGLPIATKWIAARSNSVMDGFKVFNATGQARTETGSGDTAGACLFCLDGTTNSFTRGTFEDFNIVAIVTRQGDQATFKIKHSSDNEIIVNIGTHSYDGGSTRNGSFFYLQNTGRTLIHDGYARGMSTQLFEFERGISDIQVYRYQISYATFPSLGIFNFNDGMTNDGPYHSTGTMLFAYNDIEINGDAAKSVFNVANAGGVWAGVRIKGNTAHGSVSNSASQWTFATLTAGAKGWVLQQNNVTSFLTFISDSGTATLYTGQGNTLWSTEVKNPIRRKLYEMALDARRFNSRLGG